MVDLEVEINEKKLKEKVGRIEDTDQNGNKLVEVSASDLREIETPNPKNMEDWSYIDLLKYHLHTREFTEQNKSIKTTMDIALEENNWKFYNPPNREAYYQKWMKQKTNDNKHQANNNL